MPTKVSEYMSPKVITASVEMGVREAFFLMREKNIRHLPVVDEDGKMAGIVSDRELRRPSWVDEAPDIQHVYNLTDDLSVGDVMVRQVHVTHTYETLSKAVKTLLEHHVGALPVLNKEDELVGMLSAVDLLHALDDMIEVNKGNKKLKVVG